MLITVICQTIKAVVAHMIMIKRDPDVLLFLSKLNHWSVFMNFSTIIQYVIEFFSSEGLDNEIKLLLIPFSTMLLIAIFLTVSYIIVTNMKPGNFKLVIDGKMNIAVYILLYIPYIVLAPFTLLF